MAKLIDVDKQQVAPVMNELMCVDLWPRARWPEVFPATTGCGIPMEKHDFGEY